MKSYRIFFLILLQNAHIFSCSNIELYQDFITNYTKQAQQAEERFSELHRCKDKQALEKSILEVHPESPYETLIPHESYKALNISGYATDNEISSSLLKLKNAPDANINQLNEAYQNISNHRNIKYLYTQFIAELKEIPTLKAKPIGPQHSINAYAHLPAHINQDNCIANYIKNRTSQHIAQKLPDLIKKEQDITQELKKIDAKISQEIRNYIYITTKILVVCGVGIIISPFLFSSFKIIDKSFDI